MMTLKVYPVSSLSCFAIASPPTVNWSAVAEGARAMMMWLSAVPRGLAAAAVVGASVGASVVAGAAVVGASVAAGAAVGCAHALTTIEASTRTEIRTNIMLVLFFTSFLL